MYMVLEWDRELWDGPRAGTEGALEFLGVDEVSPCTNLIIRVSIISMLIKNFPLHR